MEKKVFKHYGPIIFATAFNKIGKTLIFCPKNINGV